jgi:hypothetical protein
MRVVAAGVLQSAKERGALVAENVIGEDGKLFR